MNTRRLLLPTLLAIVLPAHAQDAPPAKPENVAKLYDVLDLIENVAPTRDAAAALTDQVAAPAVKTPEPVARLIRAFVKPPLGDGAEVQSAGERWIVAVCTQEQQAWIGRFLQAARGDAQKQQAYRLSFSCYSLPESAYLKNVLPTFAGAAEEPVTDGAQHLTEVLAPGPNTEAFLAALGRDPDVTLLNSPQMRLFPLNVGSMAVVNQTSYVRDFDIKASKNVLIADPIVDVIRDGIELQAALTPTEDGRIGVSLDARVADLKRPIDQVETEISGCPQKVTIQLPYVRSTRIEAAVEIDSGQIIVLAPPGLAGKRTLFVVEVVAAGAEQKKSPAPRPKDRDY